MKKILILIIVILSINSYSQNNYKLLTDSMLAPFKYEKLYFIKNYHINTKNDTFMIYNDLNPKEINLFLPKINIINYHYEKDNTFYYNPVFYKFK